MTGDSTRMTIWTGYFDSRTSRRSGRRVPRDASIPRPSLDQIAMAARSAGITKMRRDQDASHPLRPSSKEGRLIVSTDDALASTSSANKEGVLKAIGQRLKAMASESEDTTTQRKSKLSGRAGARQAKQRKAPSRRPSGQRKKKFGRR